MSTDLTQRGVTKAARGPLVTRTSVRWLVQFACDKRQPGGSHRERWCSLLVTNGSQVARIVSGVLKDYLKKYGL